MQPMMQELSLTQYRHDGTFYLYHGVFFLKWKPSSIPMTMKVLKCISLYILCSYFEMG